MGDWYWDYPKSGPRAAKGGIKAQSRRGAFGESWWAKRWLQVLESFDLGARLDRGRRYARRGQVLNLTIGTGRVTAQVQGSRARPYEVTIRVKTIPGTDWKKVARAMGAQAAFAAELLAGRMPGPIEEVFRQADLSLFPQRLKDLETACSCPDWSNPCKHIAAVYFLLGEEFDRDPFLIFALRGCTREKLLALLPLRRRRAAKGSRAARIEKAAPPAPLSADPARFWGGEGAPQPQELGIALSEQGPAAGYAALPQRLGSFPLWRGEHRFLEAMEGIYRDAVALGLDVLVGQANLPLAGPPSLPRARRAERK